MKNIPKKLCIIGFSAFFFGLVISTVWACNVPVFRYALERWPPDDYGVMIKVDGELTEDQQAVVTYLEEQSRYEGGPANIAIRVKNEKEADEKSLQLHALWLPKDSPPIWSGDLTMENAAAVLQSALRDKIAQDILGGKSAVWVLLESGNPGKDEAAIKTLNETLEWLKDELEVPEGVIPAGAELSEEELAAAAGPGGMIDPSNILDSEVPLKIDFSVVRVPIGQAGEDVFKTMLMSLEPDLHEYTTEPMLFPVFGRGRALEPLVGEGINEDNIAYAAFYLCGPCSCQVKYQNPGRDLLVAVNWDEALVGQWTIEDRELPPLVGTAELVKPPAEEKEAAAPAEEEPEAPMEEEAAAEEEPSAKPVSNAMMWLVTGVLVLLAAGTLMLSKKK